jgi:hypothetical protein
MTPSLLFSVERRADLFVAHDCGNFVVHVAQGYIVMFTVVGVDTVSGQDYPPVSLVGVNGGGANASVGVDAGEDNGVGPEPGEGFVESGSVKCAIPFLREDDVIAATDRSGTISQPGVPLMVTRIPLACISGNASRRSGSNSWRTQIRGWEWLRISLASSWME